MYLNQAVKIPNNTPGITKEKIKGVTYFYYSYGRKYDAEKKHTVPQNTTIGKCIEDNPDMMYPNTNFLKFFPDIELPEEKDIMVNRSSCLRMGTHLVLRRIIAEYRLEEMLAWILGKDSELFLDLAIYMIITENRKFFLDISWFDAYEKEPFHLVSVHSIKYSA